MTSHTVWKPVVVQYSSVMWKLEDSKGKKSFEFRFLSLKFALECTMKFLLASLHFAVGVRVYEVHLNASFCPGLCAAQRDRCDTNLNSALEMTHNCIVIGSFDEEVV